MAKRKRYASGNPAIADKTELFTAKLAEALYNQALGPAQVCLLQCLVQHETVSATLTCLCLQADRVAAALAKAVHQLPTSSAIHQSLQADLPHYTKILNDKLQELQSLAPTPEEQSIKKQKADAPESAGEQCFAELRDRQASLFAVS